MGTGSLLPKSDSPHWCVLQEILREVGAGDWELLARRRVRHFGYKFEYEASCSPQAIRPVFQMLVMLLRETPLMTVPWAILFMHDEQRRQYCSSHASSSHPVRLS